MRETGSGRKMECFIRLFLTEQGYLSIIMNEPAAVLYVSRTAISKCESGGCYPAKDSLKEIAEFYSVSIDDLLSGERLISIAFYSRQKVKSKSARAEEDLLFDIAKR